MKGDQTAARSNIKGASLWYGKVVGSGCLAELLPLLVNGN